MKKKKTGHKNMDVTITGSPTVTSDVFCDICGKNLCIKGRSFVAFKFDLYTDLTKEEFPEYYEVLEIYGKTCFNICSVCYLKNLGVKPK